MKNDKRLATLIVLVVLMFLWLYVRPVWVRSNCYKTTHPIRPHENDYEWAEGKNWVGLTLLDEARGNRSAGWKYSNNQEKDNEDCLLRNGIKN